MTMHTRLSGRLMCQTIYPTKSITFTLGGLHSANAMWDFLYSRYIRATRLDNDTGTVPNITLGSSTRFHVDADFVSDTTYPNCVAVGASTEANKTYFKVKVGGTIKRVICYDDA